MRENNTFSHEALFYSGEEEFLSGVLPFIREAIVRDEPMLIALHDGKIQRIKAELNADGGALRFADMEELGRNPACIIPAWRDFASDNEGRPIRGIGEPIWPGRSEAELAECHHHESLLNLAFDGRTGFRLLCPYDAEGLDDAVLAEAHSTHPVVAVHDSCSSSRGFLPPRRDGLLEAELPEPPADRYQFRFGRADLYDVRRLVLDHAVRMLPDQRAQELVLAASELATNSVLHGGGGGTVTMWSDEDSLFCEIRDAGRIEDPLIGRERPGTGRSSGRGLWIVNQLCDLVQLRALPLGNVARVQMRFS